MNILIVLATPYLPQMTGGAQSSCHEIALELLDGGHNVSVLAGLSSRGQFGLRRRIAMKLSGGRFVRDDRLGYPVLRKWFVWDDVDDVINAVHPDAVLVQQCPTRTVLTARNFLAAGTKTAVYLRDVEVRQLDGDLRELGGAVFLANSRFTAGRYGDLFGIRAHVIPPIFQRERYETAVRPEHVTYVNPHPLKGSDLALEIAARCPDIPFTFVKSWGVTDEQFSVHLRQELKSRPNVSLQPETSDIRQVFARTRFVLMPSRWEEAWGRVATEAQFSGIPIVASNTGGLPEAVGPGGDLVDPAAPVDAWVAAVRRMWDDRAWFAEKSKAALAYSQRPELDPKLQMETLLAALR